MNGLLNTHHPKGPRGSWATGQRVPVTGYWENQYGQVAFFERHSTFPPRVGRINLQLLGSSYWTLETPAATGS